MMVKKTAFIALFLLCAGSFYNRASAADDIIIRLLASPESPWTGQQVVLHLDVLATDGWAQVPSLKQIETEGGLLRRYESQGTRLNETIDGNAYSGQRYEFLFFAFQKGTLTLGPFPLDVVVKKWGVHSQQEALRQIKTPTITLQVRQPADASGEVPIISSTRFSAVQTWQPQKTSMQRGDSITRIITREADEVSAMIFSPLAIPGISGVATYTKEPTVDDRYNSGKLTGIRKETITYIMERSGHSSLPELQFFWWNSTREHLESVKLPGLDINVAASPNEDSPAATAPIRESLVQRAVVIGVTLVMGSFILFLLFILLQRRRISFLYKKGFKRRHTSEKALFKKAGKAARGNNSDDFLRTTMHWLDSLTNIQQPARLDLFLQSYGEKGGDSALPNREAPETETPEFLFKKLSAARKNYLRLQGEAKKRERLLPPLSPYQGV